MKDLYLVYKNLTRKKLRLFLTGFAIFIAFLIFGAVMALQGALNSGVEMAADNRLMVMHKTNFTLPLPYAYVNKVKGIEGVSHVTHANWFGGYYQQPDNQVVTLAVDPTSYFDVYSDFVVDPEQLQRWQNNQTGAMVGEVLAKAMNWKVGDRIPISSNIFSQSSGGHSWELTIDGIFQSREVPAETNNMLFHYDYFNETHSFADTGDTIGWLILTTEDPALNEAIIKQIDEGFANSQAETETTTEKAFSKAFVEQIGNIGLIIFGVVFTAFFIILMVVGNTMVLAIRERTGEIAVLKTLGFSSKRIFSMVLAESCVLSLLGGFAGLGAAWLLLASVSKQFERFLPNLHIDQGMLLQAVAYMLLLGLITGIIPATRALRLNIVSGFNRD